MNTELDVDGAVLILDEATVAGAGPSHTMTGGGVETFEAYGTTSDGRGSAIIQIQVSNDGSTWQTAGTISLDLGTNRTSNRFTMDSAWSRWTYVRSNLKSISGTGASVSVYKNDVISKGLAAELAALPTSDLFEMFPLPTNRTIVDAWSANLAGATLPAGATAVLEEDVNEFGGSIMRIDLPSGLSNAAIVIPINATRGEQPKALLDVSFRLAVSDWSSLSRFYAKLGNVAMTEARLWVVIDDSSGGKSQYGHWGGGVYPAKWNGVYRTLKANPFSQVTKIGSVAWDENTPEYSVNALGFTVSTSAPVTIRISRVYSQEWSRGAIVQCADGGYQSAHDVMLAEFSKRRWPGVVSRLAADDATYTLDEQWRDFKAANWDVCQHIANGASALTAGSTTEQVRQAMADFKHYARSLNVGSPGNYLFSQFLTNAGMYVGQDLAGILRAGGIQGSRGVCSDAEYGIDPWHAKFDKVGWNSVHPHGFVPKHGRYNRWFVDSSNQNTPELRNTYAGSDLQRLVAIAAAGKNCGINYIHRIQTYNGTNPTTNNVGDKFFIDYLADLDTRTANQSIALLSASQLDSLTYSRPGGVYVRWDGEWVSRETGRIVI